MLNFAYRTKISERADIYAKNNFMTQVCESIKIRYYTTDAQIYNP